MHKHTRAHTHTHTHTHTHMHSHTHRICPRFIPILFSHVRLRLSCFIYLRYELNISMNFHLHTTLAPYSQAGGQSSVEWQHNIRSYITHCLPRWSSGNVLAIGPKVRGFKPGRGRWTFKGDKICNTTSFGREVKFSVPCRKILLHVKE
jgi:hypothetical protein